MAQTYFPVDIGKESITVGYWFKSNPVQLTIKYEYYIKIK